MANVSRDISDQTRQYLLKADSHEHPALAALREKTAGLPDARMQISPEQGRFMAWLLRIVQPKRCIEVGVFTGYSSTLTALQLPDDGQLIACDVSETWTDLARETWQAAGVEHKIDLILAPAAETLQTMADDNALEPFDFAFIDADKVGYPVYYRHCLAMLRPGGVIVLDNALLGGRVAQADQQDDANVIAMREVTDLAMNDDRVDATLNPLGDGLLMVRKR